MADRTKIEWTDASWTPIRARETSTGKIGWHCEHVSEGCRNCYAEGINRRLGTGYDFKPGHRYVPFSERDGVEVFLDEKMLTAPLKWKRPRMIFVCSMTDLFGEWVTDEMIDRVFAVMALCPQHTFQVLTKRSARMRAYIAGTLADQALGVNRFGATALWTGLCSPAGPLPSWPLPNVWLGVSCEDQARADERIPDLLATPAAVRFVSLEPLLGAIDLTTIRQTVAPGFFGDALGWHHRGKCHEDEGIIYPHLDWAIVGGESGPHARPMHPDWARSIRDQCQAAGVAFFMKQWGEWEIASYENGHFDNFMTTNGAKWLHDDGLLNGPSYFREDKREGTNPIAMIRVGKRVAGRLLDGVEHNGMPG